jgi:hypothetical protein
MGAPVRSLAHLQGCADVLREATEGQYSKGIKAAKKAMENAKLDFKATIDRVAEASKWKKETIEDWISRGELVCAKLVEKAEEVLKEAEAREEAEAKIQIMEGQCEELARLAVQAGNQVPAKAEVEVLEELEEEIGQRKEMVGDLGGALKETVPEELKGRVEEAMKESFFFSLIRLLSFLYITVHNRTGIPYPIKLVLIMTTCNKVCAAIALIKNSHR